MQSPTEAPTTDIKKRPKAPKRNSQIYNKYVNNDNQLNQDSFKSHRQLGKKSNRQIPNHPKLHQPNNFLAYHEKNSKILKDKNIGYNQKFQLSSCRTQAGISNAQLKTAQTTTPKQTAVSVDHAAKFEVQKYIERISMPGSTKYNYTDNKSTNSEIEATIQKPHTIEKPKHKSSSIAKRRHIARPQDRKIDNNSSQSLVRQDKAHDFRKEAGLQKVVGGDVRDGPLNIKSVSRSKIPKPSNIQKQLEVNQTTNNNLQAEVYRNQVNCNIINQATCSVQSNGFRVFKDFVDTQSKHFKETNQFLTNPEYKFKKIQAQVAEDSQIKPVEREYLTTPESMSSDEKKSQTNFVPDAVEISPECKSLQATQQNFGRSPDLSQCLIAMVERNEELDTSTEASEISIQKHCSMHRRDNSPFKIFGGVALFASLILGAVFCAKRL